MCARLPQASPPGTAPRGLCLLAVSCLLCDSGSAYRGCCHWCLRNRRAPTLSAHTPCSVPMAGTVECVCPQDSDKAGPFCANSFAPMSITTLFTFGICGHHHGLCPHSGHCGSLVTRLAPASIGLTEYSVLLLLTGTTKIPFRSQPYQPFIWDKTPALS